MNPTVNPKSLDARRALITGASAGIGESFAREFAQRGFDLVLVARREDRLEQLAQSLADQWGVGVQIRPCDLQQPDAAQQLFDSCAELTIDVLINNAGVMYHGAFSDQTEASIEAVTALNIASLTQLTRLFLHPMLARGQGRILNVTSTSAFTAGPRIAVYAASKAYILSFTEAIAEELRGSGVYATAFCPGSTDTRMLAESFGENLGTDTFTRLLMMSSEAVAAQGYKACMAGSTIRVPGVANNVMNTINRLQPKWLNRRLQTLLFRKFLENR
jgi:short-subunit dehydrogenase